MRLTNTANDISLNAAAQVGVFETMCVVYIDSFSTTVNLSQYCKKNELFCFYIQLNDMIEVLGNASILELYLLLYHKCKNETEYISKQKWLKF